MQLLEKKVTAGALYSATLERGEAQPTALPAPAPARLCLCASALGAELGGLALSLFLT